MVFRIEFVTVGSCRTRAQLSVPTHSRGEITPPVMNDCGMSHAIGIAIKTRKKRKFGRMNR
jgi:hypothetical protein